jgi:lauroyl/myristoyl acyltransferase
MPSRIKYLPEYLLLYLFTRIIYILPFNFSVKIGRVLGRLVYRLDERLGIVLAEFFKIPAVDKSFLDKRVSGEGFENYLKAKSEGKGVLMLGAHPSPENGRSRQPGILEDKESLCGQIH